MLKKWCAFLEAVGIRRTPEELLASPAAWGFVSWGLLQAHLKGLLNEGYATPRRCRGQPVVCGPE